MRVSELARWLKFPSRDGRSTLTQWSEDLVAPGAYVEEILAEALSKTYRCQVALAATSLRLKHERTVRHNKVGGELVAAEVCDDMLLLTARVVMEKPPKEVKDGSGELYLSAIAPLGRHTEPRWAVRWIWFNFLNRQHVVDLSPPGLARCQEQTAEDFNALSGHASNLYDHPGC